MSNTDYSEKPVKVLGRVIRLVTGIDGRTPFFVAKITWRVLQPGVGTFHMEHEVALPYLYPDLSKMPVQVGDHVEISVRHVTLEEAQAIAKKEMTS